MKTIEFDKLLKKYKNDPHMLIRLHCMEKIYLNNFQLDKVLKLRGERK